MEKVVKANRNMQAKEILELVEEKLDSFKPDEYIEVREFNLGIISLKLKMMKFYFKKTKSIMEMIK
jgi:hypothetical protein